MIESTQTLVKEGKKSLNTLLREKAYEEVSEELANKEIDINNVAEEDIEALVAAKVDDMTNNIRGFATGSAFVLLLSSLFGF